MISVNRLVDRKSPFPVQKWILDSGAFTRISSGKGHLPLEVYADEINRWSSNGELLAAVVQDFMCEPFILAITGKSVQDHQELTIDNYDCLVKAVDNTYIMPVLQGYEIRDYLSHLNQYGDRLKLNSWVGIGSVCKRNGNPMTIASILIAIKNERPDLKIHGFGIKTKSLQNSIVWDLIYSADSQAHGLSKGGGSKKYVDSNNPLMALQYANSIIRPNQLSIFS